MSDAQKSPARALVLGGGGVIGVAWETGVVHELAAAGFGREAFSAIVGTSAGAIVGAQFAAGRPPFAPRDSEPAPSASDANSRASVPAPPREALDMGAIGEIFGSWAAMDVTTQEAAAKIGARARTLYREYEAPVVASYGAAIAQWPQQPPIWIAAVDTATGQRRVFEPGSGVPLGHAIAASASVPGLFASVEIEGALYMDGQVHSSTNADLLLPRAPLQVVIACPTNAATGGGIGPHAERMLAREVAALEQAGCTVVIATPSAADAEAFGRNLMDPRRRPAAYAAGVAAGRALAAQLALP